VRNWLSHFGLVRRFAAGALATFAVVTIVLLVIVSNQLRTSQESAAEFHAVFITDSVLRYELTPADLAAPVTRTRANELKAFIQARVLAYPTLRIKIWAPDGTIVYSDDFRAIGLHFSDDQEEKAQDTDTPVSEVASPSDPENIYDHYLRPKLFSTYVPLQLVGASVRSPQAIVEVYQDYAGIQAVIDGQARALIITLLVALFGLFLLLLPLVSRAARELRQQNLALGSSERRFRSLVQNSSLAQHKWSRTSVRRSRASSASRRPPWWVVRSASSPIPRIAKPSRKSLTSLEQMRRSRIRCSAAGSIETVPGAIANPS
jgi:hypothetical protein